MKNLWLIIGRFQPFHKWHALLVDAALENNSEVLILIGSSNRVDFSNPFDYELRKNIIKTNFPEKNISLWPLPDFQEDSDWIQAILTSMPHWFKHIDIYCWDQDNDSAIKTILEYKEKFPTPFNIIQIPRSIIPISATEIRTWIDENNQKELDHYLSKETLSALKVGK